MRPKSLPISVRAGPRPEWSRTSRRGRTPRQRRDLFATIPMVLLIPLLVFPLLHASAGGPTLAVRGTPLAGAEVIVAGARFHPQATVELAWDGSTAGMPTVPAFGGKFTSVIRIPAAATPGRHTLSATAVRASGVASRQTATTTITVIAPTALSATPSATALVLPIDKPAGTVAPTQPSTFATATGSPAPTAVPTAKATTAPTPVPATPGPATPAPPTVTVTPAPATPAPAAPVIAGAIYVSPAGNDANPGTIDRPLRTISRAFSTLRPGMTLYVRGGTYAERVQNPSITPGESNGRITVTNYPGERPVIQGLLWLKGADYWTVNGINVTWGGGSASEHMYKMVDGIGWVIVNSEIWGARSFAGLMVGGTVASEPAGWQVVNNCIHDTIPSNGTNQDHNVYVNTGLSAGAGTIAGNLMFNATNGENIKLGGPSSGSNEGSANVTIRSNTLYNAAQPILLAGGTRNTLIEDNLIVKGLRGSLVRGYQLSGAGNVARGNLGYDAASFLSNDSGYTGVKDGGANLFPVDPLLTSSGCALRPTDPTAVSYGR